MNLKDIINYIPGFRSNKVWKKVIASIYYFIAVIMLFGGIGQFLFIMAIPFFIFNLIPAIKTKKNEPILATVIAAFVFIAGTNMLPKTSSSTAVATNTSKPVQTVKATQTPTPTATPKPTLSPEDQAKADAEAKATAERTAAEKAAVEKAAAEKAAADKLAAEKAAAEKAAADKIAAEKAAAEKAKADYQTWIKNQFSAWDGSHIYLVELIKKNLNDDKSFRHVETTYVDKGDYLIVKMTYRASNSFGATILQNVTAKADYKTNMITVISQND
jgi:hypothetical protein